MASKNEQKIQEIVDAMAVPGIISTGAGNEITGNQIASKIREIPKRTAVVVTNSGTRRSFNAYKGYYPFNTYKDVIKYTGVSFVRPTTSAVILSTNDKLCTTDIRVDGDANLIPANIKNGVSIFGVSGTYTGTQSQIPYVSGSISLAQDANVYLTEIIVGTSSMNVLSLNGINGLWNIPAHSILTIVWNSSATPYFTNGLRLLDTSPQMSPRMFTFEVIGDFSLQA